jgi:2-methylisocitrate lyase-like PEP mutase family enzyme
MDIQSYAAKVRAFLDMHDGPELLLIPNAWDVASAVLFERAGFAAIATSSAGIAWKRWLRWGERSSLG